MTFCRGLLGLCVVMMWGIGPVAGKIGLSVFPPFLFIALACLLVAAVLAFFYRPPKKFIPQILFLSTVIGVGNFGLFYFGMSGLSAGASVIVMKFGVPFSALFAAFIYHERLGWQGVLGILMALVGIVALSGDFEVEHYFYLVMILGSSFCWAVSNMMIKKLDQDVRPAAINGWMALFAVPQLLLLSFLFEEGQWEALQRADFHNWLAVGYIALFSLLFAYLIWDYLLGKCTISQVIPFYLLTPVVTLCVGYFVLNEALTVYKIGGCILMIMGVAVVELHRLKRGHPARNHHGVPMHWFATRHNLVYRYPLGHIFEKVWRKKKK